MYSVIIGLIIVSAVLLVLVVLAQNSKGGGLSSQFSGSGNQVMGVKRTTDLLEKLTWGFAIAIIVFSMTTTIVLKNMVDDSGGFSSPNIQKAQEQTVLPGLDAPIPAGTEPTPVLQTDTTAQ